MAIIAQSVTYSIGDREILHGVSAVCETGKLIALSGPSGCGKTTFLGILGLLTVPTSGTVSIGHEKKWNARRRRIFWRDEAAFIWQDYGIIEEETVAYNVTLHRHLTVEQKDRLARLLKQVGLVERSSQKAAVLSGGEQQRVGIARALWKNARYIFADEPTASLDASNRRKVYDLLRSAADRGACVITATHDVDLIALADTKVDLSPSSVSQ
jgi:ABC-type lipoprotein export system ATPase subunit